MDEDLLTQGIAAAKAGNVQQARQLLDGAIRKNPNDERGWGWFFNVAANDEERIRCLREVLRINPNNQPVKKKLDELTSNSPFLQSQKPLPVIPNQLAQPSQKIEKRGLPTWEKILLPVLVIIALVTLSYLVFMISGPFVKNVFDRINANLLGTSTSIPQPAQAYHTGAPTPEATITVLQFGSDLIYKNWSIHIDRIETKQTIEYKGDVNYSKNGRFAILHLSVTNTGNTQEAFLPIIETAIIDADNGPYMSSTALAVEESFAQGIEPEISINPHQTISMLAVYDISSSSRLYLLGILSEDMGVLLDIPNGISSSNATTTPLWTETSLPIDTSLPIETLLPTFTPLPQGSSFVLKTYDGRNWQIKVTRIETADTLKASYGNAIVKAAGRFAIIFMDVTNLSLSPGTFVGSSFLKIQDASGQKFEDNFMATNYAQDLYNIGYCAEINPDATGSCVTVYDISKQSNYYLLVPSSIADPLTPNQLLIIK